MNRVCNGAEHAGRHGGVEGRVRVRQLVNVGRLQVDGDSEAVGSAPCPGEHPFRDIDPGERHVFLVVGEVLAGADSDLERSPRRLGQQPPAAPAGAHPFHRGTVDVVQPGHPVVAAGHLGLLVVLIFARWIIYMAGLAADER